MNSPAEASQGRLAAVSLQRRALTRAKSTTTLAPPTSSGKQLCSFSLMNLTRRSLNNSLSLSQTNRPISSRRWCAVSYVAAHRPELSRIMMHEGAAPSERLAWFVETQLAHRHRQLLAAWTNLRNSGIAAEVDRQLLYHSMIGAASLLYANERSRASWYQTTDYDLTERHAQSLVALLLPGRNKDF